jgi:hypothetical protein
MAFDPDLDIQHAMVPVAPGVSLHVATAGEVRARLCCCMAFRKPGDAGGM